ncbi:hypothetical protein BDZ89DRAFT_1062222 [Hymenopellis radicata]|nr:hypothetical protein BDZ89DRAFT_1062222 [Hymenopellis radicata]
MATCARCGFKPEASSATDSPLAWNVDVLDVLRSGDALPSAATAHIPGRVAVLGARYQAMQDDLACLEELVAQKRKKIASACAEIEQTNSLAAPIRSIPHEILLYIFSLVDVPTTHGLDPGQPPCSFGHVCKFWRTLSRSAPSLWSRVLVDSDPLCASNANLYMNVLERHLVLSNPRPLHVELFFWAYGNSSENTEAVLDALSGHSIRLQELEIYAGKLETECFFDMLSKSDLRLLKCLKVQTHGPFPVLEAYDIVFHASLRSLKMDLPFTAFKSVQGQWQTLTSFTGPFAGAASFHRFIAAAENLARLRISCIGDEEDSQTRTVFVHEKITHLTLGPSCSMSLALDNISLPRLEKVILDEDNGPHSTCPPQPRQNYDTVLSRLLDRSQCNLKTFILGGAVNLEPQTLTSIWRMSNLISLQLHLGDAVYHSSSEVSTLLDSLTVTPSQQPLPGLRELEIACGLTVDHLFTNSKLYDLVASRWNVTGNVSRLSKLTLENYIEPDEPHITYETSTLASFLLNLKDQGLDVVWKMNGRQDVLADAQKAVESHL